MKVLLVYPENPPLTYWSFSRALALAGKRANSPPLGLATVAALLPEDWEVELVDMNIEPLSDDAIAAADLVMTSSMIVQADSLSRVLERCHVLDTPVAVGGPHPSAAPDDFAAADHVITGEAEDVLPRFVDDFARGEAKRVYHAEGKPPVTESPVPRFDLLDQSAYACMAVQYSRGCPYSCEFCDIWTLYGHKPRVKERQQMLAELDALYTIGWRGSVFFVDDNFIGNRKKVRQLLEDLVAWQEEHGYPFTFFTEASVNLAEDERLLERMRDAGFNFVFLGIETPSTESLAGANKGHNTRLDLLEAVRTIQRYGIEVSSGFIVGFDEDQSDIFDRQIEFIHQAGIPMAMVGILTAMRGTALHDRLTREGRLLEESGGNNTHAFKPNFVTRMPAEMLSAGYRRVMQTLYDPNLRNFFARCRSLLAALGPNAHYTRAVRWEEIRTLLFALSTIPRRRWGFQYLRFLIWSLVKHPRRFPEAVRLGVMGSHFHAITREAIASDDVESVAGRWMAVLNQRLAQLSATARESTARYDASVRALMRARLHAFREVRSRLKRLGPETRAAGIDAYRNLVLRVDTELAAKLPTWVPRGAELLADARQSFRRDLRALKARCAELRQKASTSVEELQRDLERFIRDRRVILQRAKRRVKELPKEYRLLGRMELAKLRAALDSLPELPAPA